MHRRTRAALLVIALSMCVAVAAPADAGGRTTVRVSTGSLGQSDGDSNEASISADGRYVAFESSADNLVPNDTNDHADVFVRDRTNHKTYRVSIGVNGQADGDSAHPSISADGRYVAFESSADNLVSNDTNGTSDVFVRDRVEHKTFLVSTGPNGEGDDPSDHPSISADGRYVAFESSADNLVPHDTNGVFDVFVRDRVLHKVFRVSVRTGGRQGDSDSFGASISADGRYVAFESSADNLVLHDTNGYDDVFIRDREEHTTARVSVGSLGEPDGSSEYPSISAGGRYVAFASTADNLVARDANSQMDIFVRDRTLHKTFLSSVSTGGVQGNSFSEYPSISSDGRYVVFQSLASNLVPNDTNSARDIFIRDRTLHRTLCVSVAVGGGPGSGGDSQHPDIAPDGSWVAFESYATNLVQEDTNAKSDVFVHGPYG